MMPDVAQTLKASSHSTNFKKRRKDLGAERLRNSKKSEIDSQDFDQDIQSSILLLENGILESRKNYNNITTLLDYMTRQNPSNGRDTAAAVALCRSFCRLMVLDKLTQQNELSTDEKTVVQWLRERLQKYEEALLDFLQSADSSKQATALTLLMRLIKEKLTNSYSSEAVVWHKGLFRSLLERVLASTCGTSVIDEYVMSYVVKYVDIRYFTFAYLSEISFDESLKLQNALHMLGAIEPIADPNDETEEIYFNSPDKKKTYTSAAQKKQAQKAWTSILRQRPDKAQRKKILDLMTHRIAPWFLKTEMLMDFLTDAFDIGGSTSLMALSGLFHLIQEKNLDYPQFYMKLYSLLDTNLLHSKHRSRFFRLLDTFLASTHLPAALVASFIKRLSRLCLFAPPTGIVIVVPCVYNLLQSHRSCTFMIHRTSNLSKEGALGWGDPFRMDEPDPMETDAIESSLWEIHTLQSHYHPNVAAIAKIISEPFTKQAYNLEDFLDHSYATMLNAELSKEPRKPPEIEYEIPKKIFTKYDVESGKEDGLLVQLWNFD